MTRVWHISPVNIACHGSLFAIPVHYSHQTCLCLGARMQRDAALTKVTSLHSRSAIKIISSNQCSPLENEVAEQIANNSWALTVPPMMTNPSTLIVLSLLKKVAKNQTTFLTKTPKGALEIMAMRLEPCQGLIHKYAQTQSTALLQK